MGGIISAKTVFEIVIGLVIFWYHFKILSAKIRGKNQSVPDWTSMCKDEENRQITSQMDEEIPQVTSIISEGSVWDKIE